MGWVPEWARVWSAMRWARRWSVPGSALGLGPRLSGLRSGAGLEVRSAVGSEAGWSAPSKLGPESGWRWLGLASGVRAGAGSAPRRLAQRSDGVSGLESAPEW